MRWILLILIAAGLLSCDRKSPDNSRGPQTSLDAISSLQKSFINRLDPYSIEEGQRVHFIESQEIISSQGPIKALSKEWVTEVTEVENTPEERTITTYKTVIDKLWDKDFTYIFKGVYFLEQVETLRLLNQLDDEKPNRYSMESHLQSLMENGRVEEKEITGIAFHNLVHQQVVLVPPEKVKNAANCKGFEGCRINADQITYDVVFLLSNDDTQTHRVEWIISQDVPFFAAILKQCSTTVIPVDNLRVLVKQCNEVVDFDD